MTKLITSLLIVLFVVLPSSALAIQSVDQDPWIYHAISLLVQNPNLSGFEVMPSSSRYEAAVVVSRIIHYIERGQNSTVQRFGVSREILLLDLVAKYNEKQVATAVLSVEQVEALLSLATEFREELVILGYAVLDCTPNEQSFSPTRRLEYAFLADRKLTLNLEPSDRAFADRVAYASESSYDFWETLRDRDASNQLLSLGMDNPRSLELSYLLASRYGVKSHDLSGIDSQFLLGSGLHAGASYLYKPYQEQPFLASVEGQYAVSPDLLLEGRYSHSPSATEGLGMMQLGAVLRMGDVELAGSLRARQSGYLSFDPLDVEGEGQGIGFSLRLGDLSLSTAWEQITDQLINDRMIATRVGLSYGLPNSVLITAEYRHLDSELRTLGELGALAFTSLELNIPVPQGRLQLGMTSELAGGGRTGQFTILGENPATEYDAKKTASVGFQYLLGRDMSLNLNYQLIDFTNSKNSLEDHKANVAIAEFSIRF